MQFTTADLVIIVQYTFPFLVAFVALLYKHFVTKLPAAKQEQVRQFVSDAVQAIEQTQQFVPGPNKKVQAEALIGGLLKKAGLQADPILVDTLIETAVYNLQPSKLLSDATIKLPAVAK